MLTMMILKYDIVRREVRNLENMTQRAARMHIHCRFGIRALYFFFCVSVIPINIIYQYQYQYDAIVISE